MSTITLRRMTEAEFQAYLDVAVAEYAEAHVRAGNWPPEDAPRLAREQYAELLPQGVESPEQYLYSLLTPDEPQPVGMVWAAIQERQGQCRAFIYDIRVYEPYRRRGYASAMLRALEPEVRALGATQIGLHVFGDNHGAQALYEKMGYRVTDLWMTRSLDDESI